MRQYAQFRVEWIYQWEDRVGVKFFFTPPDGEEKGYGVDPKTVPAALTKLNQEGKWRVVGVVGFPRQVSGGQHSDPHDASPSQMIYTLERVVPEGEQ